MSIVKLRDIANVTAGQSAPQGNCFSNKGTPFIRAGSLELLLSGKREDELELVSDEVAKKNRLKLQPAGTIVFAKSGMSCMKGYVYVLKCPCYVANHLACVSPINVNSNYLAYYFMWHKPNQLVKDEAYPSISLNDISNISIEIHSDEKQNEIVAVLDKVNKLISLRKQQLEALDVIVKSRFVEMFGDCKNKVALNDLCSIITDGTHQPPKFQDKGIPFIFVSNLANNTVIYNTEKFISEETYSELYKRTPIEIGDLLLSTVGSYGHPAVVVEDRKFLFQRHIAYLKPKRDKVNSFYLHSALLAPDGQRQIEEKVKGVAQKTLNLSEIKKIMIPVPIIEKQNAFADFVHQVDKSKSEIQKSLEKLEILKKSLMQKYFG